MAIQNYPAGLDCIWIAVGVDGQVACFITAGEGPIPEGVLAQAFLRVEDVEGELLSLPKVGTAELKVDVPRPDDFVELAERGFYVYDWTDIHKSRSASNSSYELVAAPGHVGVRVEELPENLKRLARSAGLEEKQFGAQRIAV